MALIDPTYFIADLQIANISNLAVSEELNLFINRYEAEFMQKSLGYEFNQLFAIGLMAPTPDQRWLDIKNGKEYTYNSNKNKWAGFVNSDKKSPIANYVFCLYMENIASRNLGVGIVKQKAENGYVLSPINKIVNVWNKMVDMQEILIEYLMVNSTIYPEFKVEKTEKFEYINSLFL